MKVEKEIFFESVGYKIFVKTKPKLPSEGVDEEHEKEMKDVYRNLNRLTESGEKYTSLWCFSHYEIICA